MGWFFVNIVLPVFGTIGILFVMKIAPVPQEYKDKAQVIKAVRDGQLGWVVVGIGSGLLYEAFSMRTPNHFVTTFVIVLICVNALLSGFGIMFPFNESDRPKPKASFWEKVKGYSMLSATAFCLVCVSLLYTVHHFYLLEDHSSTPVETHVK